MPELPDWIDLAFLDQRGSLDDIVQDIAGTDRFDVIALGFGPINPLVRRGQA
jgi:hypothetical protein